MVEKNNGKIVNFTTLGGGSSEYQVLNEHHRTYKYNSFFNEH